ncbi:PilN domain-containing protein [Usitatibacter palustris]|uniref:General secretion pathway protein L n=1 Tax=Usitatibacter palustris TaxID=2732487 RepID=A0A6M4HD46_9PROT|nr:PilN domain-containing protein [Usitatibacter palustris]QJR16474.1 hypothetical protein DSM104440_03309 [Usitatibacter palustris]
MATPAEFATARAQPAWQQRALAFWRWWSGELEQWARAKLGGLPGMARAPLISVQGDDLVIIEARASGIAETSRSPLGSLDPEGRRLALRNLVAGTGENENRVRLCLAREQSLLRRVSLPLATEENLERVLAFEMDRLTPFRAEEVYFDHRVASRDPATGKVHLDLGVARRDVVDPEVARLGDWGANVVGVVLLDDVGRSSTPLDLLPVGQRGKRGGSYVRNIRIAAAVVALLLLATALIVPLYQKRERVVALNPLVTKARAEAEATDRLSKELEKLVADYNFLLTKKHTGQPSLAIIEDLTNLLPDNTWVQQLDLRPAGKVREVQISGETTSSSKLIEILEQSKRLQNSAPRGAFTRGSQPGTERFMIAAEVRPRPLPEPVPAK